MFAGIEAASVAWGPLGWEPAAFFEVEPFACAVLEHHYPGVPNLGDVTKITEAQVKALGPIDAAIMGWPCQDLSVAGKRKGLRDTDGRATRSGLFFDAMRIADWAGPRWLVGENVPGLFSSHGGRDFALVVAEMAGAALDVPAGGWRNTGVALGPKGLVEWAVLDAQWRGLAQRRKRVFLVRDSGDWAGRPPLLLERESLRGDHPPRRETGARTAAGLTRGADGGGRGGMLVTHSLSADGFDASEDGTGRGTPIVPVAYQGGTVVSVCMAIDPITADDLAMPQTTRNGDPGVVFLPFDTTQGTSAQNRNHPKPGDPCHPPACAAHAPAVAYAVQATHRGVGQGHNTTHIVDVAFSGHAEGNKGQPGTHAQGWNSNFVGQRYGVRRLTPVECLRLQGFEDDYLDITYRGKPAADGPKYRATGNSMATTVIRYLGEQIERAHNWPT